MPLLRYDTSPYVIEFNDSSPFTKGLGNLLAAALRYPAIREEQRFRREQADRRAGLDEAETARADERLGLARNADRRAQEKHDRELSAKSKSFDPKKVADLFDEFWPEDEEPEDVTDDLGTVNQVETQRRKRDWAYNRQMRTDAKQHAIRTGEVLTPKEYKKRFRQKPDPSAGSSVVKPFADKMADKVSQGMQEKRGLLNSLLDQLGLGGGAEEPTSQPAPAPAPAPAEEPRSEEQPEIPPRREPAIPVEYMDPEDMSVDDRAALLDYVKGLQDGTGAGAQPLSPMDKLADSAEKARWQNAPRRAAELMGRDYDQATDEHRAFYDELGIVLMKAQRNNQKALKRLQELRKGPDGTLVNAVIAAWNADRRS